MTKCDTCGRFYPSPLEAALCSDADATEWEDRRAGVVYRSSD